LFGVAAGSADWLEFGDASAGDHPRRIAAILSASVAGRLDD
jgi:hypothetical protein